MIGQTLPKILTAIVLCCASPTASVAQGTPNVADANLLTEPFLIPTTDMVIDVPMAWDELPTGSLGPSIFESVLGMDEDSGRELASFGGQVSGADGFGAMIISNANPFFRTPMQEIRTIEQGIKLSRVATWITGSGMAIVRPSHEIDVIGGTGASVSFLSGQEGAHDIVTITIVQSETGDLFIVDLADKDSEEAVVLDQMRASLRPQ